MKMKIHKSEGPRIRKFEYMKWISVGKGWAGSGENGGASHSSTSPKVQNSMVQKYSKCLTNLYMGERKIMQVRESVILKFHEREN